jgi:hypothetical protein
MSGDKRRSRPTGELYGVLQLGAPPPTLNYTFDPNFPDTLLQITQTSPIDTLGGKLNDQTRLKRYSRTDSPVLQVGNGK